MAHETTDQVRIARWPGPHYRFAISPTANQSSNIPHTAPCIDPDHVNHGTDEDGGRDNPHQRLTLPRDLGFALGGLTAFLGTIIVFVEVLLRQWSIRGVNKLILLDKSLQ